MDSPCPATSGASVLTGGTDIKQMNSSRVEYMTIINAFIKEESREGPSASGRAREGTMRSAGLGRRNCHVRRQPEGSHL